MTETIDQSNPFAIVRAADRPGEYIAITREAADYALGVLPPIWFRHSGSFAIPEPVRHEGYFDPVYLCVVEAHGKPWAIEATIENAMKAETVLRSRRLQ